MAGRELSTAAVMFHSALAEKQGLSATEEKALDLLSRFGPLTAGELSARSGLAPPSVTGLVNRLEKKGYVRRVKDESDGRKVRVEVVPDSMNRFSPLFVDFVQQLNSLFSRYTIEQLEVILDFLEGAAEAQRVATRRLEQTPARHRPR